MAEMMGRPEMGQQASKKVDVCYGCALPKEDWRGNQGAGYEKKSEIYCCEGCADDTGCICGAGLE